MENIQNLLDGAIVKKLKELDTAENSEEVIKEIVSLHGLRMAELHLNDESKKNSEELAFKQHQIDEELKLKRSQFDEELQIKKQQISAEEDVRFRDGLYRDRQFVEEAKDRVAKIGIAVAELVLPLVFYDVWVSKGLSFEKEGTFTSSTFKTLINRFKPTKK